MSYKSYTGGGTPPPLPPKPNPSYGIAPDVRSHRQKKFLGDLELFQMSDITFKHCVACTGS